MFAAANRLNSSAASPTCANRATPRQCSRCSTAWSRKRAAEQQSEGKRHKAETYLVGRRDVEDDGGICGRECAQLRAIDNLVEHRRDVTKGGTQAADQLFAGIG